MTTFIYALCEPETRVVQYIGKANNPSKRLRQHVKDSIKQASHLGKQHSEETKLRMCEAQKIRRNAEAKGKLL